MKAKQVLGCLLSAAMVTSCLPGTAFAAGAANKPTDGGKEAVKADDTAGKIVSETTGTKENGIATCGAVKDDGIVTYKVYLPDGYSEDMSYPTVYLMPYDGYSADIYINDGIAETLDSIMNGEDAIPMVVVMPEFTETQDYDTLLGEVVADVEAKYSVIPDKQYRAILGVNVGGYMAYENALVAKSDLFYGVGSHMGDFISEANPYLEKGAITDNLPDSSVIRSGDYYYYIDAPNGDAATTVAGGTKDIGYKLEVNSGAYGALAERYRNYGGATSDLQYVEYAVLAGNADADYYLAALGRSMNRFSTRFTENIYDASLSCTPQAVTSDVKSAKAEVTLTMKEDIAEAEKDLLHTYNRYQIVLDKGDGVYLYDIDGKKYLDFVAGIAVFALGYQNKAYNDALKAQIDKVIHTSNYYYNVPAIEAARKIKKVSGMDRVFFTNSGAEAVEGAIKAARKYAYLKDGCTDHEIIAMNHSFHGRTMGALSVTGNPKYREAFQPMIGHIKFADLNNFQSVLDQVTDKTCAIIMETVQGEGGLYPATEEFLKQVRDLCDERDILLILDEIQCGMGRTGYMYAWQRFGVKPDIMTSAKALGCGVPVGAFMMTEKVAQHSLTAGDHGTTYGGNPLACTAVEKVLDLFEEDHIIEHVREVAPYLEQRLNELAEKYDCIQERRGVGLMQGLVFDHPVGDIINRALEKGLILINAGADIIRFVPPLVITRENVDEMIAILDTCIE